MKKIGAVGRRTAALALALGLAITPTLAADDARPKYPPYPDVWGRELPVPQSHSVFNLRIRGPENGEIAILYIHFGPDLLAETFAPIVETNFARSDFFSGLHRSLSSEQFDRMIGGMARIPTPIETQLANGKVLLKSDFGWIDRPCAENFYVYWEIVDSSGRHSERRMLLWLRNPPERTRVTHCAWKRKLYYTRRVWEVFPETYMLTDETFLVEDAATGLVLRFRPDLSSPFVDTHPNLFWVDADMIDRIAAHASRNSRVPLEFGIQATQDAVAKYLKDLKRAKERNR